MDVSLSIDPQFEKHSVARIWNEALLQAIRTDYARPTVHARNLFHVSMAMYDAWAAMDTEARPFLLGNTVSGFTSVFDGFEPATAIPEARREAISFAAYRVLCHRFAHSPAAKESRDRFDNLLVQMGYDTAYTSTDYSGG
jgi:hypothetical protein